MTELPHLPIIDPDATLGQLGHQFSQREVTPRPLQQAMIGYIARIL